MGGLVDKLEKNAEKVIAELKAWRDESLSTFKRFRYVTLIGMDTRVPQNKLDEGYPDNNEVFHLLTGLLKGTYQELPRTLTYLTIIFLVIKLTTMGS